MRIRSLLVPVLTVLLAGGGVAQAAPTDAVPGTTSTTDTVLSIAADADAEGTAAVTADPVGVHSVLVIRAYWTAPDSLTAAQARTAVIDTPNAWYREMSYGSSGFTGDVIPDWVRITGPVNSDSCYSDTYSIRDQALAAALTQGYDAGRYDRTAIYFPRAACNDAADPAGWAVVGGRDLWLDGWTLPDTVVHEFGHLDGLDHSRAARCTDPVTHVPVALAPVASCSFTDDPTELMGASGRSQFSAPQKNRVGWLAGRTVTLTPGTSARLTPLETGSARNAAVLTTPTGRRYWVEYRQPIGLDAELDPGLTSGLILRMEDPGYASTPVLLDMTPTTDSLTDCTLGAGRSWRSPDGYTFTASQVDATGATVTVQTAAALGAPTGVTTRQDNTAGTATLTWAPPATDGGRPVTGYRVSRDGTGSTGTPAWSAWMPADARTRTFVNLAPGTPYTLTVRAVTAAGDGPPATRTVTMARTAGVPTQVTATRQDAAGTATLTWAPPATDGGRPVTGYRVSRNGTGSTGTPAWSAWMPADARTRTFVNLAPGTPYTLTVRAVTAAGDGPPATRTVTLAAR